MSEETIIYPWQIIQIQALIAPKRRVAHGNVLPVVPPLPPRLNLGDPCVWSPARPFRTRLPF